MRKFTSLMLMLLCAVTTWSQISALTELSNDKVYTFKSGRSSDTQAHYLLYHADAPNNLSSITACRSALNVPTSLIKYMLPVSVRLL